MLTTTALVIALGTGFYLGHRYGPAIATWVLGFRSEITYLRSRATDLEHKLGL